MNLGLNNLEHSKGMSNLLAWMWGSKSIPIKGKFCGLLQLYDEVKERKEKRERACVCAHLFVLGI